VLDPTSGAEVVRLTNDGNSFRPVWSPDGNQIAYLHRNGLDIDLRLMTLDLSNGLTLLDDKPITKDGTLDASSTPAWFVPAARRTPVPTAGAAPAATAASSSSP
jgi:Tol biopolymer transport system component